MNIDFICPNGHQLNAPEQMAGKAGKCPRCGSKFLIPTLDELQSDSASLEPEPEPEPEPPSKSKGRSPASPSSSKSSGSAPRFRLPEGFEAAVSGGSSKPAAGPKIDVGRAKAESPSGKSDKGESAPPTGSSSGSDARRSAAPLPSGMFMFLCPNGHKLNGPVSLKGKPGQCPHCGAKFRIPADDDEEEETPAPADSAELAPPPDDDDELPTVEPEDAGVDEGEVESDEIPSVEPISVWQIPPPPPGHGHRLAELFHWVWAQRETGCVVELTLKDGRTFEPSWFSAELSVDGYGAFAVQDELGRFTMSFLPWDSVAQLTVVNLEELPPQFES